MSSFALSPHSLTVHVLESEKMDKFLEALDCWFLYCEFRSMFIFYDIWLNILNGSRQSSDTSRSCQAWLLGFYFRDPPQLPFPLAIQISLVLALKKLRRQVCLGLDLFQLDSIEFDGFFFPTKSPFQPFSVEKKHDFRNGQIRWLWNDKVQQF